MENLQYPIGKFAAPESVTPAMRQEWIAAIAALPQRLEAALDGITDSQLDTPYRPEGWTVRQVVHHLADSHINAYCRLHLVLTEDSPTIKPYFGSCRTAAYRLHHPWIFYGESTYAGFIC